MRKPMTHVLGFATLLLNATFAFSQTPTPPDLTIKKVSVQVPFPDGQMESVTIPWDFKDSSYLEIDAIADIGKTTALLAPLGFKPVAYPDAQHAVWSIFAAQHRHSDLANGHHGAYNEFFITVLSQPVSKDSKTTGSPGSLVYKIWVSDEGAMVAGNTYWNCNKELAYISPNLDPNGENVGFDVKDIGGNSIASASIKRPSKSAGPQSGAANLILYTQTKQVPTSFFGSAEKMQATPKDEPIAITFGDLKPNDNANSWATTMKDLGLQPVAAEFVSKEALRFGTPIGLFDAPVSPAK